MKRFSSALNALPLGLQDRFRNHMSLNMRDETTAAIRILNDYLVEFEDNLRTTENALRVARLNLEELRKEGRLIGFISQATLEELDKEEFTVAPAPFLLWHQKDEMPVATVPVYARQAPVRPLAPSTPWPFPPGAQEPKAHDYWRPNEPDCPKDILAGNGELHTLRCKVCGLDNPKWNVCQPPTAAQKLVGD